MTVLTAGTTTTITIPTGAVLQLNGSCDISIGRQVTSSPTVIRLGPYMTAATASINAKSDVRLSFLSQESERDFGYPGNMNNVVSFEFATEADSLVGPFEKGDLYKVAYVQSTGKYKILTDVDAITWSTFNNAGTDLIFVSSLDNLPSASGGIITLPAAITYYFTRTVDLSGSRLVAGANTTILGTSSENARIKSTGLAAGTALLTSQYTLPMRHITLEHNTILNLDPGAPSAYALDWYGINFEGATNIGRIANYANVIISSTAFLSAYGLTMDGTIGTVAITDGFLQASAGTLITIPATATIQRRFRILNSSFVATGSATGLNVNASASIPVEGYILGNVNFSGGATYITGVTGADNKSRWYDCRGISNSSTVSSYTMQGNATATVIAATATPVKVAGTTVSMGITQRFTNTANRATYIGAISREFKVSAVSSITSGNGNQIGIYIAKNGTPINESETYITTNAAGRLENGYVQTITTLSTNDYIEIFVENNTAIVNITVEFLNVIIEPIPT